MNQLKDEELARIDKEANGKLKEKAEKINKLRDLIAKKASSLPTPAPDTKVWRIYVKLAQEAGLKVTEFAATLDLYVAKGSEYLALVKDMGIRFPKIREAWMKGDASKQKEINQYKLDQQKARDLGARLSPLAQKNNEICIKLHNKYNDDVIAKLVGPMGRTAGALAATFAPGAQDWVYSVNFDNPPPAPTPAGPSGAWRATPANRAPQAEDPSITDEPKEDHYNSDRETEKAYN